eukprot:1161469-Pelagomonas_calceolata.AAC.45
MNAGKSQDRTHPSAMPTGDDYEARSQHAGLRAQEHQNAAGVQPVSGTQPCLSAWGKLAEVSHALPSPKQRIPHGQSARVLGHRSTLIPCH